MPVGTMSVIKWVVRYLDRPDGKLLTSLHYSEQADAQELADQINAREPWRQAEVASKQVEVGRCPSPPRCYLCGATKVYDLFKGDYCPRCNDRR
jgi:hypothetical protein